MPNTRSAGVVGRALGAAHTRTFGLPPAIHGSGTPALADFLGWSAAVSACAHRFAAGHRLRPQVSGGAHPRFVRNPGNGGQPAMATTLAPVR